MEGIEIEYNRHLNQISVTYNYPYGDKVPVIGLTNDNLAIYKFGERVCNEIVKFSSGCYVFDKVIEEGSTLFLEANKEGDLFHISEMSAIK